MTDFTHQNLSGARFEYVYLTGAAIEPLSDRSGGSAAQEQDDGPSMAAVTMHVHGRRPVSELASALTELDLVDAVVAASQPADD